MGQQFDIEYGYNLAGQLTSEKYPAGRIVTNGYDAKGRMASVSDASRTYLSNLEFQGISGSLSSMTFGNGVAETFSYNDRGQMTQMAWTKNNAVINRYDYLFGQIDPSTNAVDATKNNGQLAQVNSYINRTVLTRLREVDVGGPAHLSSSFGLVGVGVTAIWEGSKQLTHAATNLGLKIRKCIKK